MYMGSPQSNNNNETPICIGPTSAISTTENPAPTTGMTYPIADSLGVLLLSLIAAIHVERYTSASRKTDALISWTRLPNVLATKAVKHRIVREKYGVWNRP